jgi:CheY-like chemotaxis protein
MLLNGKHVFIVEDNLQNRVIFQMSLMRHGAVVEFERWGKDALFRLQNSPPLDIIVLDLMLADGYSGFDIFEAIRALPKFDAVPIVAVSAMDPSVALPKTRAKGFSGFIAKPIDNRLFPQQLAQIIEGKAVWYRGE